VTTSRSRSGNLPFERELSPENRASMRKFPRLKTIGSRSGRRARTTSSSSPAAAPASFGRGPIERSAPGFGCWPTRSEPPPPALPHLSLKRSTELERSAKNLEFREQYGILLRLVCRTLNLSRIQRRPHRMP